MIDSQINVVEAKGLEKDGGNPVEGKGQATDHDKDQVEPEERVV